MAKNIVIFSDGTGNTAIKGRGTNVFKMFEAVDLNGHRTDLSLLAQIASYDDGVGTENFKLLKIFSGATGWGLSRNVKQLYKELCRVYEPKTPDDPDGQPDQIYLFGFSRGAFTVRSLVGFIATAGLVSPAKMRANNLWTAADLRKHVNKAYRLYKSCYPPALIDRLRPRHTEADIKAFRERFCHDGEVRIRFLGVWDTVDAVGLPLKSAEILNTVFYRFKFPDTRLSDCVDHACQALAIDDERDSFQPLLWDVKEPPRGTVEQVWFAGAHSNVGGGYPKQGMSLVALDWMMAKAEASGLRIVAGDRRTALDHASVDDKLYDPRAGLGVFYRWRPRDIEALCREKGIDAPVVHVSVLERIGRGTEDYAPGNLPPRIGVAFTPTGDPPKDAAAAERAVRVQLAFSESFKTGGSLISRVPRALSVGYWSYWLYVATSVAVVLAATSTADLQSWPKISRETLVQALNPAALISVSGTMLKASVALVVGLVTSPMVTLSAVAGELWQAPALLATLLAGFAVAFILSKLADDWLSAEFTGFWHQEQGRLLKALKGAREAHVARQRGPGD